MQPGVKSNTLKDLIKTRGIKYALSSTYPAIRYFRNLKLLSSLALCFVSRVSPKLYKTLLPNTPLCKQVEHCSWLLQHYPRPIDLERMRHEITNCANKPLISIIMPVYNTDLAQLAEALDSVVNQVYPNWELCVTDDASTNDSLWELLTKYSLQDSRIKIKRHELNAGISAASNTAISMASGSYIAQLDHDDVLTPHALWSVVKTITAHPNAGIIYSDEDKIDEDGSLRDPFFKQDWCPDSFLSKMYTCHFGVYKRELIDQVGGFRSEFDGAEDYDLVLRLSEQAQKIVHIPDILYHWRIHQGSAAYGPSNIKAGSLNEAGKRAVQSALARRGERGVVEEVPDLSGHYSIRYSSPEFSGIRIVILLENTGNVIRFRDWDLEKNNSLSEIEFAVVSTSSQILSDFESRKHSFKESLKLLKEPRHALDTKMPYLLFLDSNLLTLTAHGIEQMLSQARRKSVGAVGPICVDENDSVIHSGVILGPRGGLVASHGNAPASAPGYFGQLKTITNYSALGPGCIACKKDLYLESGGFDWDLPATLRTADFCLKLFAMGYHNVCLPDVVAKFPRDDLSLENTELDRYSFYSRWESFINHDPCYNPNLSLRNADYRLRVND